jgi:CheY-like chemotaxis protein
MSSCCVCFSWCRKINLRGRVTPAPSAYTDTKTKEAVDNRQPTLPATMTTITPTTSDACSTDNLRAVDSTNDRILIVEDNLVNMRILKKMLSDNGIADSLIDSAENGSDAIEACTRRNYRLIFMDIHMPPGISGIEACQRIRQLSNHTKTPIICQTTDTTQEEVALKSGMNASVEKPYNTKKIKDLLDSFPIKPIDTVLLTVRQR